MTSPVCLSYRSLRRIGMKLLLAFAAVLSCAAQSDPSLVGQWAAPQPLPYRPIHSVLLPTGKVLMASYYSESMYPQLWDPATGETTAAAAVNYALFCSGHSILPDGRVLFTGGWSAPSPPTDSRSRMPPYSFRAARSPQRTRSPRLRTEASTATGSRSAPTP